MGEPKLLVHLTADDLQRMIDGAVAKALATKAANTADTRFLTTVEAAKYLGITRRVLLGHVSAGRLVPDSPARPGFAAHRFYRSTLDAFMVRR